MKHLKALLSGVLLVVGLVASAPTAKAVIWDFQTNFPPGHPSFEFLSDWARQVEKRTAGGLKIRVRAVGELPIKPTEFARAPGEGRVELGDAAMFQNVGDVPVFGMAALPFLFHNMEDLRKGIGVLKPLVDQRLKILNGEMLFWYMGGGLFHLWGTRGDPAGSLKQLQGFKVRAAGPAAINVLRKAGMSPISMAHTEVATALQQGLLDGTLASAHFSVSFGHHEFYSWGWKDLNFFMIPIGVIAGKPALARLPPDVRQGLLKASQEFDGKDSVTAAEDESMQKILARGVRVVPTPKRAMNEFLQVAPGVWQSWVKENGFVGVLEKIRAALDR